MDIRGIIFDLDDTLIRSGLDFDAIRQDMGLQPGQLILESIEQMDDPKRQADCLRILREHELRSAHQSTLIPGVTDFLSDLQAREVKTAVLTRNSRETVSIVFERLDLNFSIALTREDAPPKPDPSGLEMICQQWGVESSQVLFFGDFGFDIQAGQRAGIHTVLFAPGDLPEFASEADSVLRDYSAAAALIDQLSRGCK
ncbi:MAG: phosphatase [Planctomycetaceae bacterium]|nr:phosphatase [Planctomycetaceae bacterium]